MIPSKTSLDDRFDSPEQRRVALKKYSQRIISGVAQKDVVEELKREFNFTKMQAVGFFANCKDYIASNTAATASEIIPSHIYLYEQIFMKMEELDHAKGALQALKQKEKIMGLLQDDERTIIINNKTNVLIDNQVAYNRSNLSEEQRIRLDYILAKASNPDGLKKPDILDITHLQNK